MTIKHRYKTVWLSDIHLGCKDCKAEYLLNFLNNVQIDTLYLVGDIIDMWAMSKQFRWPQSHNDVLHKLLALSKQDTKVIYLPGNHDEPIQKFDQMHFGDVEIHRQYVHTTAKNEKLLVLHGDQFDQEVCLGKFHSWIGDKGYDLLLFLDRWFHIIFLRNQRKYWSLARYIKRHVKSAQKAISRYRQATCQAAKDKGYDGVVCGHIHHPEITMVDGIRYCNDGDWLESCSALVENQKGDIELIYWPYIQLTSSYETPECHSNHAA